MPPLACPMQDESIFMSATSSPVRVLRLPRDLALVAVGIDAALIVINMGMLLLPATPAAEQMRSVYATPGVWVSMLAGIVMSLAMVAVLAWSHGRHALERRGVARVALAHDARLRFGGVWALAMVLNYYALTPLLFEFLRMFMPGGRFEGVFDASSRIALAVTTLVQLLVQLVIVVLGLWLAARVALARSGVAPGDMPGEGAASAVDAAGASGVSPRRAAALVIAAMYGAAQLWGGLALARWVLPAQDAGLPALLLSWVVPLLGGFALAFWGGWLGTRPGLSAVRPFRAVAAAVLSFVLVQAGSAVVALAWLFLAVKGLTDFYSGGAIGAYGLMLALLLVYLTMAVAITRGVTRRLYRRYL